MRKKESMLVVTFYTTAEAMAMEGICRKKEIPGKLFSAPRDLSADCGIAWKSPVSYQEAVEKAIQETSLEIHGLHIMEV